MEDRIHERALRRHIEDLQDVADAHDGTRAAFTPGYAASVDLLEEQLQDAGYEVHRHSFTIDHPTVRSASFAQLSPTPTTYMLDGDEATGFSVVTGSPSADVTGPIYPVDVVLHPDDVTASTSGCDADDYDAMPAGAIALVQFSGCGLSQKFALAAEKGASAVLVFNQGSEDYTDRIAIGVRLVEPPDLPGLSLSYAFGEALARAAADGPVEARIQTDIAWQSGTDDNLWVETWGGDPATTVLVGAHLDSVPVGPGINDNGSGTSLVLELALLYAKHDIVPRNKVRFAWWGAEELGLVGSYFYKEEVAGAEQVYLNFDMVGTVGGFPIVYAGDSPGAEYTYDWEGAGEDVGDTFAEYFREREIDFWITTSNMGTDSGWWMRDSVPHGGLFTWLDDCYHQPCDDADNIDYDLMTMMTEAAAHAVEAMGERRARLD